MSADRDEFEQCVLACLEAPDDLAARARRDVLLAAHPEWAADRTEIEALWRAAHLTAPALDDTIAPEAPELPPEIEAQLLAAHRKPRAKPRLRLLLALAASITLLLTLGAILALRPQEAWVLNADGQFTSTNAPDAKLAYADGSWRKLSPWEEGMDPRRRTLFDQLTNQPASDAPPVVSRNASRWNVEVWSPLSIHRKDTPFILFSPVDRTVRLELKRFEQTETLWQQELILIGGQPLSLPPPPLPPIHVFDLYVTPLDRPLAQQRLTFGEDETLAAIAPSQSLALQATQLLLENDTRVGDVIVHLLPHADENHDARRILRAIAVGYRLPGLAAYVDQLAPPPPD